MKLGPFGNNSNIKIKNPILTLQAVVVGEAAGMDNL
jgi:hypothetical protein